MFTKKGTITVKEACKIAFDNSPNVFHGIIFIMEVRRLINRPACMDGSIFRRLRELRDDDKVINYRCKDNDLSIYQKMDVKIEA